MSTEAKIKHTADPWVTGEATFPGAPHAPDATGFGPDGGPPIGVLFDFEKPPNPERYEANARLVALAPTAPHRCSDPTCPGDRNRRLLEAGERLAEVLRNANISRSVGDALAAYQEAAKS